MKKYQIILADPPWAYKQKQMNFQTYNSGKGNKYTNAVTDHYKTMTNEEIKALHIANITDTDCLLFLWVTSPNLDIGIEVGKAWGFEFKTVAFVWEKQRTNYGFYTLSSCELCLVFKKGKIPKRGANNIRQFISEKLRKHSQKPEIVRENLIKMYPDANRIELFAREKVEGWDTWGNEIINDIDLLKANDHPKGL